MSTKEEVSIAINDAFYEKGGFRDVIVEEVDRAIDVRIGRWFIGGGVVVILTIASGWFTLSYKVNTNSEKINDALTSDQAALIIQRLDQLERSVNERNQTIEKLDDRLRSKGI